MPIWSVRVRSIPACARPRQILPPPTTMPICTQINALFHAFTDMPDNVVIQTGFLFSGQSFAAELEQNSFVRQLHFYHSIRFFLFYMNRVFL
jgi:hypothetical protein